jgi:membrane-associated protease RseP (regulator of RpoE activity)
VETVLLYILGIVIVVVGLVVSVGLHELGHLLPAKKFGVHVGQYMIGFGPTIWSRRIGETEYGFKAIPAGGYISMAGMYPPAKGDESGAGRNSSTGFMQTMMQDARAASADTVAPGQEDRVFYKLATWKRVIIMLGGPTMNLLIGIVLYAVVLCGFGISVGSSTVGSVNECLKSASSASTECSPADEPAPGAEAGLLPGDRILSIDGTPVGNAAEVAAIINASAGTTLSMTIERDGDTQTLQATPRLTERYVTDPVTRNYVKDDNGDRVTEQVGLVGITFADEIVQQPLTAVLPAVGDNVARVAVIIAHLPQRLVDVANAAFGPGERDPEGPIGVVGIGRIAGEITSLDSAPVASRASALISVLASLNIALFVFNLIPLLPLDGGHVAGALWESLRRRGAALFKRPDPGPVDIAKLLPLTIVVSGILALMTVLLVYADIVKPISLL